MLFMLNFFSLSQRTPTCSTQSCDYEQNKLEFNSHLGHAFYFISLLYILFVMLFCHLFTMKMKEEKKPNAVSKYISILNKVDVNEFYPCQLLQMSFERSREKKIELSNKFKCGKFVKWLESPMKCLNEKSELRIPRQKPN